MYQGISTPTSIHRRCCLHLQPDRPPDGLFETLEGFPRIGRRTPLFCPCEHQCPSFLEYGEYPFVAPLKSRKPSLKAASPTCSTRCSEAVENRTCSSSTTSSVFVDPATCPGTLRVPHLRQPADGRAWLSGILDVYRSGGCVRDPTDSVGDRGLHLKRPGARCRGSRSPLSRRVPPGMATGRRSSGITEPTTRPLGRRAGESTFTPSSSFRPRRRGRMLRWGAPAMPRVSGVEAL